MVEEELLAILTYDIGARPGSREAWSAVTKIAWDVTKAALENKYHVHVRPLFDSAGEPVLNEFEVLGKIDREIVRSVWRRLPPVSTGQARVYLAILSNPADSTVGDALSLELNPLNLSPLDEIVAGARKTMEQVRAFQLLRYIWEQPQVVDGIFAAFTWELSWPHLQERTCAFDEMLADLYHWFDRDGKWVDKTYYVKKSNP